MAKSVIKFLKTREVQLPERGHRHDAGIDFFVPRFDKSFVSALKTKNPHLFETHYNGCQREPYGHITMKGDGSKSSPELRFDLGDPNNSLIKFDQEEGKCYIPLAPMQRVNIPSGIWCKMEEEGRALIAHNKSGIASKMGLIFGAQVVDYGYQGEIHINVINTSSKLVRVYEGDKLMQFVEMPIFTSEIQEVERFPELYPEGETSRADGGFGSTDKKEPEQLNS